MKDIDISLEWVQDTIIERPLSDSREPITVWMPRAGEGSLDALPDQRHRTIRCSREPSTTTTALAPSKKLCFFTVISHDMASVGGIDDLSWLHHSNKGKSGPQPHPLYESELAIPLRGISRPRNM